MRIRTIAVLLLAAVARAEYPEAPLRSTDGTTVAWARFRGKPAVVFYEDRGSTALNARAKDALFARGRARGLLAAVNVVAIANIQAYDFTPARQIATAFIRRAERQAGIPIYLDLDGVCTRAPWKLPATSSTVMVLDPAGEQVFAHTGVLSDDDIARMLETLEHLTARP
jgi:hypothetical protein